MTGEVGVPPAGRELDARVAEEVMGLDVRGTACAIFVEGEWSIHADSEPDGWACYAGIEPVYRSALYETPPPQRIQDDDISAEEIERWYQEELTVYERDVARFGCHHHDLDVVPEYSTDIAAAWTVVEKMLSDAALCGGVMFGTSKVWIAEFWVRDTGMRSGEARADTAPHAICLAALNAIHSR